jgi:hypothetical protein
MAVPPHPTPSAQPCATHPFSYGGTADTRATAAAAAATAGAGAGAAPEADASFEGISAGVPAMLGELPAVTSGGWAGGRVGRWAGCLLRYPVAHAGV